MNNGSRLTRRVGALLALVAVAGALAGSARAQTTLTAPRQKRLASMPTATLC